MTKRREILLSDWPGGWPCDFSEVVTEMVLESVDSHTEIL